MLAFETTSSDAPGSKRPRESTPKIQISARKNIFGLFWIVTDKNLVFLEKRGVPRLAAAERFQDQKRVSKNRPWVACGRFLSPNASAEHRIDG